MTPTEDDDIVKITTNLIQIDVSVTNKDGKQITDLKPEEAKPDNNRNVKIQTQVRLYREGELVYEGNLQELNADGQTDLKRIETNNAVMLGKDLVPGDYVLQVVAVDAFAKEKKSGSSAIY